MLQPVPKKATTEDCLAQPEWWTSEIGKIRRRKYHLFINVKASKFKSSSLLEQYNQTCNKLNVEIKNAVRLYERKLALTSLFKKGSRISTANYRPVSLTSAVYKVLKSIIKDSLMLHLEAFDLLSSKQHGFVRKRACGTNLLESSDFRTICFEQKQPVDTINTDFAKAYDKVPHKLLITKLKAYGVSDNLTSWISAYLSGRRQRVVLADSVSEWMEVSSGVRQGSVLGLCLFIIFVNDLPSTVNSNVKLYADDCKLMGVVSTSVQANIVQAVIKVDLGTVLGYWTE